MSPSLVHHLYLFESAQDLVVILSVHMSRLHAIMMCDPSVTYSHDINGGNWTVADQRHCLRMNL